MKIDEAGIEALGWLLPEHNVQWIADDEGLHFLHAEEMELATWSLLGQDALACEIERAWLALGYDFVTSSPTAPGDTWEVQVILSHEEDVVMEELTKLAAYVAATVELKARLGQ